jgi:hypothetical protein
VLISAAEHPRTFDHSFTEPFVPRAYRLMIPPQLQDWPHRVLIRTVCQRTTDFRRLTAAAVAAVDLRHHYRPEPEFTPYLPVAFPCGLPADQRLSPHQRAFAHAIAHRDELWDGTYHGVASAFAAASLPADRASWLDLATRQPPADPAPHTYSAASIVVMTSAAAIRKRPAMYLGVPRTSPDLLGNLIALLTARQTRIRIEAPLRLTVEVDNPVPALSEIDAIATARAIGAAPYYAWSVAAALSIWVTVHLHTSGLAYRQQFVDQVPAGPIETCDPTHSDNGLRIVFELDPEWLPPGARLPDQP